MNDQVYPPLSTNGSAAMLNQLQQSNPHMHARLQDMRSDVMETATEHFKFMNTAGKYGPSSTLSSSSSRLAATEMAIVQAVQYNEIDRVKELIESHNVDVNKPDDEGCYLLHWASINNHVELVRYLIAKGATVDIKGGNLQSTPLHWACRQGCIEAFFLLIDNGAAIDSADNNGVQPVHIASHYGQIKILAYLLGSSIDVDCHDKKGFTPLIYSCMGLPPNSSLLPNSTFVCCTQFLITFGANVNYQEPIQYNTPLHISIMNQNLVSFYVLLKSSQVNIYLKNLENVDPTACARLRQNSEALKVLRYRIKSSKTTIQPIFLQKYFTNEFLRKWMTRFLLLFTLTLIGLSANSIEYPYWIRILFPILILIVLYHLFDYYVFDEHTKENFAYSYVLSSALLMYTTYWIYLQTTKWTFTHLCYHLFTIYGLYCVRRIQKVNPGFLKQQTMTLDGNNLSREKICIAFARDPRWTLDHFCITCLIRRPLRSKHCPIDKTCVAKFDHHCTWLDACIGSRNHFYFIRVLTFGTMALLLWMYQSIEMISNDTQRYTIKHLVTKIYDPWFVYIFILTTFNCIWVMIMTIFHLFNSILGITINERLTHFRYNYFRDGNTGHFFNPFRNQLMKNFLETFGLYRLMNLFHYTRIDWSQIYDINQITETKIK